MSARALRVASVAVAVLLAAVTATVVSARSGGPALLGGPAYTITVVVPDAHGLVEDADVLVRGVEVGAVEEVEQARGGTRLTLSVDEPAAPLREDATVRVATKTLLEEAYVDLRSGDSGRRVPSGGELASDRVRPTVELDEALAPFAQSGAPMRSALASLSRGLRSNEASARTSATLGELRHAVGEARTLTETLDGQERELARGMAAMRTVLAELGAREGAIRRIARGSSLALAEVASHGPALDVALRELPRTLGAASTTLRATRPLVRERRPVVADVRRASPHLAPALREVGPVARDAADVLAGLPRVERAGVPLAERSEPLVRSLRPVAQRLAPAVANLVPIVRHLSPRREGISALLAHNADATGARKPRGAAARVFLVDERGTATGRRGDFDNNAYPFPGDARDPEPYVPGSYPRLRPLLRP